MPAYRSKPKSVGADNSDPVDPLEKREAFASKLRREKRDIKIKYLRDQLVYQNHQINPQMKFLRFGEIPSDVTTTLRDRHIVYAIMEDTKARMENDRSTFRLYVKEQAKFFEALDVVRKGWFKDKGVHMRKGN